MTARIPVPPLPVRVLVWQAAGDAWAAACLARILDRSDPAAGGGGR